MTLLKRFLFSLVFLLFSSVCFAGFVVTNAPHSGTPATPTDITIRQSTGASTAVSGTVASIAIQLASAPASGSMFELLVQSYAAGGPEPVNTPTGYSLIGSKQTGNLWEYVFNKRNYGVSVGSDTISTVSTNPAYFTVFMVEYSTTATTAGGFASSSGTGTSATVDVTVSGTGCVVQGLFDHSGATTTETPGASFVSRQYLLESASAINGHFMDYGDGSNVNSGTYTPTLTYGASRDWIALGWYLCQS